MPYTARLYDPGTPSPLEAALAAQVGSGQSPFAGAMLGGYGLQRQLNAEATNQATMQQHMADLQNILQQKQIEGSVNLGQSALTSGRDLDILNTVGQVLGIPINPEAVAQAGQLAGLSTVSDAVNKATQAANYGSEAGVTSQSPLLAQLGIGITPTGVPRDITKQQMASNATIKAAQIAAGSREAAAKIKAGAGGGGKPDDVKVTVPGIGDVTRHVKPGQYDTPAQSKQVDDAINNAMQGASAIISHGQGTSPTTDQDTPATQDPRVPQVISDAIAHGLKPVGGHGEPRYKKGPDGKILTDAQGRPVIEILVDGPNGVPMPITIGHAQ